MFLSVIKSLSAEIGRSSHAPIISPKLSFDLRAVQIVHPRGRGERAVIGSVVIKSVRACNLRCGYCYYINDDTVDYGSVISAQTLRHLYESVASYLAASPSESGRSVSSFQFIWHGGEPLLMGRKRFKSFLDLQSEYLPSDAVHNSLQTNGALITEAWAQFFIDNGVGVGVSLDASEAAHNKNRPTRHGAPSYHAVLKGIKILQSYGIDPGILSVIDNSVDGDTAIEDVLQMGIKECDFLLPITNHATESTATGTSSDHLSKFLVSAFKRWTRNDSEEIDIRLFRSLIKNAFGFNNGYLPVGCSSIDHVIVLETDGSICMDPDFSHIDRFGLGRHYSLPFSMREHAVDLRQVAMTIRTLATQFKLDKIPDECQNCQYRSLCRGAHPASRYSSDGSFDHRSANCEAMSSLSRAIVSYIVARGHAAHLSDSDLKHHLKADAAVSNSL